MDGTNVTTIAVAIYIGAALFSFFGSLTRDLITPIFAGIFPGTSQSLDKITIQVGTVKINIGEFIGATLNLIMAYMVVSLTLPYIKSYAPIGGRR